MDINVNGTQSEYATAIIPKGTVITGNIETNGKLEMYGEIRGNIISKSRLNINGDVYGDVHASEICMKEAFVKGNVQADSQVLIQQNTVVLGDVQSQDLLVDGAVQGNLDVKGCVTIGETAIVDGDVVSKSLQINNGAIISGHYTQAYAETDPKAFFADKEPVSIIKMGETGKKKKIG